MTNYNLLLISTLAYINIKKSHIIDFSSKKIFVNDIFNDTIDVVKCDKYYFLKTRYKYIKDYRILDYHTSKNGLVLYVLKSDEGEIIFGYRGTNIFDLRDIYTDFQIAVGVNLNCIKQFNEANSYTKEKIIYYNEDKRIYFTGHSLGGGLAQYCAYGFAGNYNVLALTFNGVGVKRNLSNILEVKKDNLLVDYSFIDDLVGNFGEEIGSQKVVYLCKSFFKNFTHHGVLNFYDYFYPTMSLLQKECFRDEIGVFYSSLNFFNNLKNI